MCDIAVELSGGRGTNPHKLLVALLASLVDGVVAAVRHRPLDLEVLRIFAANVLVFDLVDKDTTSWAVPTRLGRELGRVARHPFRVVPVTPRVRSKI